MEELNLEEIKDLMKQCSILIRVNNLLLSRFIVQLSEVRKELGLPKRQTFFKFELLDEDYQSLVDEFGKEETDKQLYRLDRLLFQNKQQCPHNIKRYIRKKIEKKKRNAEAYAEKHKKLRDE